MVQTRKKILILINQLEVGGTENQLLLLTEHLQNNFEMQILLISGTGHLIPEFKTLNVELLCPVVNAGKNFARLHFILNFARSLFVFRPDIIHFYLPEAYIIGGIASIFCRTKAKLVMSRRSLNNYSQKHKVLALVERFLHSRMDVILCNSKAIEKELIEEGVESKKIKKIYNGVKEFTSLTEQARKNIRSLYIQSPSQLLVVAVANLHSYKGLDDLVEAARILKNEFHDFKILIIGNDRGYRKYIHELINQLKLADTIEVIEGKSKLAEIWDCADIGVLPSHQEGFSNSILEGMISGTPMIVTNVGGNPEAIRHKKEGLIVNSKSPRELYTALCLLAHNKKFRTEIGHKARLRAKRHFSFKKMALEFSHLYENL